MLTGLVRGEDFWGKINAGGEPENRRGDRHTNAAISAALMQRSRKIGVRK